MLRALGRFTSKRDAYGSSELAEECSENCVCCVYEGERKESRFCSLSTVNEETPDIFQCGNAYDHETMSPLELAKKKALSNVRWLLFAAVIVTAGVGAIALIKPETVVFNTLVDEVEAARLNEGRELQEEAKRREQALTEKTKELSVDDANSQILATFLNKVFASKDTSQEEKRAIKEMMERAANKIDSAHAERTTIVAPMIIYGALNIYYAIKCIMALMNTMELSESITHDHILWSLCNAIGYVIATANRGHGMQSSNLTIFLLIYYVVNAVCWFLVHQRIIYTTYTQRKDIPVQPQGVQSQKQQPSSSSSQHSQIPLTYENLLPSSAAPNGPVQKDWV